MEDPIQDGAFSVSFSLRMEHVAKVTQLTEWLGVRKSVVAQRAIECLYEAENVKRGGTPTTPTPEA